MECSTTRWWTVWLFALLSVALAASNGTSEGNATTVESGPPCIGPFNASYSAAHVVFKSNALGGFNALAFDFGRLNTTALWIGSIEKQAIYRLGASSSSSSSQAEKNDFFFSHQKISFFFFRWQTWRATS